MINIGILEEISSRRALSRLPFTRKEVILKPLKSNLRDTDIFPVDAACDMLVDILKRRFFLKYCYLVRELVLNFAPSRVPEPEWYHINRILTLLISTSNEKHSE